MSEQELNPENAKIGRARVDLAVRTFIKKQERMQRIFKLCLGEFIDRELATTCYRNENCICSDCTAIRQR